MISALIVDDEPLARRGIRARLERAGGFEVIGEAFAGLRRADPALAAAIPDLPRIVAFRNILIHGYATVDDRLVWGVVERDLAGLREILGRLVKEGEGPCESDGERVSH